MATRGTRVAEITFLFRLITRAFAALVQNDDIVRQLTTAETFGDDLRGLGRELKDIILTLIFITR